MRPAASSRRLTPALYLNPIFACNSDPWGIHILNHITSSAKFRMATLAVEYPHRETNTSARLFRLFKRVSLFPFSLDKSGETRPRPAFRETRTNTSCHLLAGYEITKATLCKSSWGWILATCYFRNGYYVALFSKLWIPRPGVAWWIHILALRGALLIFVMIGYPSLPIF